MLLSQYSTNACSSQVGDEKLSMLIGSPVILIFTRSATADRVSRVVNPLSMTQNDLFSIEDRFQLLRSLAEISLRIPWDGGTKTATLVIFGIRFFTLMRRSTWLAWQG